MKVEITAKKEEPAPFDLDLGTVYHIVNNALLQAYDLRDDYYLVGGNVVYYEDAATSGEKHTVMRIVRDASLKDVEGLTALTKLREWFRHRREEPPKSDVS